MRPRPSTPFLICGLVSSLLSFGSAQCVTGPNSALSFDGGDYVRVPAVPAGTLDGWQDFTIEAWYVQNAAGDLTLVSKTDPTGVFTYALRVNQTGISFYYGVGSGFQLVNIAMPTLQLGVWRHLALARSAGFINTYVNGSFTSSTPFSTMIQSRTADFCLGAQMNAGSPGMVFVNLNGFLDEVRVWNIGRTGVEIAASLNSVLNGNEPGLQGYWRLNDAAGQVVSNSCVATGTLLHGVLGQNNATFTDDPAWSFANTAPLVYCAPTTGQANSTAASLRINGLGSLGVNGPFRHQIPTTGAAANRVTLTWQGPPNTPLYLAAGTLQTNATIVPCSGSLDLAPNLVIVGDFFTTPFPLNYQFITNASGFAEMSFTLPSSLLGTPFVSLQGAFLDLACPLPVRLTAAFELR